MKGIQLKNISNFANRNKLPHSSKDKSFKDKDTKINDKSLNNIERSPDHQISNLQYKYFSS